MHRLVMTVLVGCGGVAVGSPPAAVEVMPVASAPPVHASEERGGVAETSPPSIPAFDAAERLVAAARALRAEGEYEAALARFEAAHRMAPIRDVLFEIGRTLELLRRDREAAEVYEAILQEELTQRSRRSLELRIKQLRGGP